MGGWLLALSATGFWAGILLEGLGRKGPSAGIALGLLAAGAGAASLLAGRRIRGSPAIVGPVIVVSFLSLGGGWAGLREASVRASPLTALAGRSVTIQGTLGADPQAGGSGWTAPLQARVLLPSSPGWPAALGVHGDVWLEGRGPPPPFQAGDRLEVTGALMPLRGRFGVYLRHRGVAATYFVGSIRLRGPPAGPVVRAANAVRGVLRDSVATVFPRREGGLLLGLLLGDTSRLDPTIEEDFRATGLSHLTAVSGENLAMFLAPILGLVVWLGAGRVSRFLLGLGATAFFVLLTRAEPSVLRAAVMAGLTMLGIFLGRPRSPPAIMGATVLVLLATNPTLVYSIGFQLSVGATAGMALLSAPLAERLRVMPRGLALAAATTMGAQAGVTPLLLYHFGLVPTVTLPANLLAFPAVGPAMMVGLVAAALGAMVRPIGVLTSWAARVPLRYLEVLADRLARSPLPSITAPGGRLATLLVEVAAVALGAWWIRSRRGISRRAAIALGLAVPLFLWSGALRAGPPASFTVTSFYVGWGDAALIRSPGGATILIDGGPDPELIARKLAALGIRRLDLMVATHPHADHVVGLPAVLARLPVSLVIDPGCPATSPFYLGFLQAVHAAGVPFRHPRAGDTLQVGDVRVDVLGPERCFHGTNSDPNNDSLVLRLTDGPATVLFAGDAEQPNQTDLLRDEAGLLTAPVVKWPHHGGNTNLDEFFGATHAEVAIVSVGPNLYGDPSPSVLDKLSQHGMRVYRTDRWGDVTIAFHGKEVLIQSSRG